MAEQDESVVQAPLTTDEVRRFEQDIIDIVNGRHPVVTPKGVRVEWPANDPGTKRGKGPAPA